MLMRGRWISERRHPNRLSPNQQLLLIMPPGRAPMPLLSVSDYPIWLGSTPRSFRMLGS